MAEFSLEYNVSKGFGKIGDFSISKIFQSLNEGQSISTICEGYGSIRIMKANNRCLIELSNSKTVSYSELTGFQIYELKIFKHNLGYISVID